MKRAKSLSSEIGGNYIQVRMISYGDLYPCGYKISFPVILQRQQLYDFFFPFLGDVALSEWDLLCKVDFTPEGANCFHLTEPGVRNEKMVELLPLKVYSYTLSKCSPLCIT